MLALEAHKKSRPVKTPCPFVHPTASAV